MARRGELTEEGLELGVRVSTFKVDHRFWAFTFFGIMNHIYTSNTFLLLRFWSRIMLLATLGSEVKADGFWVKQVLMSS